VSFLYKQHLCLELADKFVWFTAAYSIRKTYAKGSVEKATD